MEDSVRRISKVERILCFILLYWESCLEKLVGMEMRDFYSFGLYKSGGKENNRKLERSFGRWMGYGFNLVRVLSGFCGRWEKKVSVGYIG